MSHVAAPLLCLGLLGTATIGCRPEADATAHRPRSRIEAIASEGGQDSVRLRLYRSPPDFRPGFTTYVPENVQVAAEARNGAFALRFSWPATPREIGLLYAFFHPPGTDESAAREVVRTVAERFRIPGDRSELTPAAGHPWALVEYPIRSQGRTEREVVGWVSLTRRGNRWLHLTAQHPRTAVLEWIPELILREWRWTERGEPFGAPGD